MNEIKLSIIVPYYNTKEYTETLLQVLSKQIDTFQVEVILVDDCSDDDQKIKSDFALVLQTPTNCGPSVARNMGLDVAKGKYVAFVDSDDVVSENYVDALLSAIENSNGADVINFCWQYAVGDYGISGMIIRHTDGRYPDWNHAVWKHAFRRDAIGTQRFNTDVKCYEDGLFLEKFFAVARVQYSIQDVLYTYRPYRQNSIMDLVSKGVIYDHKRNTDSR